VREYLSLKLDIFCCSKCLLFDMQCFSLNQLLYPLVKTTIVLSLIQKSSYLNGYLLNKIIIKIQTKTIKLDRNKTFVFFSVRPKTNANNTFKYVFICSILVCFSTFYYYNFFFLVKIYFEILIETNFQHF
jgi:hypothetical protein